MSDLEKHADWLDYKKKISSILNGEPLEKRHNPIVEVQVSEEEWRKIQTEKYIQERLEFIRRNSIYGLMKGEETKNE